MEVQQDNLVEITFTVDEDLYEEASKVCAELGTTLEEVTVAFLKFCIVPDNLPKVKEILGIEKAPHVSNPRQYRPGK